jgi:hypothetical protein
MAVLRYLRNTGLGRSGGEDIIKDKAELLLPQRLLVSRSVSQSLLALKDYKLVKEIRGLPDDNLIEGFPYTPPPLLLLHFVVPMILFFLLLYPKLYHKNKNKNKQQQ